jgi:hypothetical protein
MPPWRRPRGCFALGVVYLPALLNVSAGFQANPQLERWFERGRVSLRWAQRLETLGLRDTDQLPQELQTISAQSTGSSVQDSSAMTGQ